MLQSFNRLFTGGNKDEEASNVNQNDVVALKVEQIVPNEYQPRTQFDDEKIEELAQTLQTHGIIQPIVVRKKEADIYEVIAGERRLRAAKLLGWEEKGGNSTLMEVVDNAHSPTEKGFVFMDTPGYDVESVTGLVAGGAQI